MAGYVVGETPAMDAGVAAVCGAVVGALGTGGAGLLTALFNRSQARMQLRAEYQRMLREPRRSAYVAYVEIYRSAIQLLEKSSVKTHTALVLEEARESYIEEALHLHEEACSKIEAMAHQEAVVYVEGPLEVTNAVVALKVQMYTFAGDQYDLISSVRRGENPTTVDDSMSERLVAIHGAYLDFLHEASSALGPI